MPSLVVLASGLTGYAETVGYVWPADAQRHRLVDEGRYLGVEFLLVQPCAGDPLEDLGRGEAGYPFCRAGRCRSGSVPVARLNVFDLLLPGPAHVSHDAGWVRQSAFLGVLLHPNPRYHRWYDLGRGRTRT
jgi:hypothetical protein